MYLEMIPEKSRVRVVKNHFAPGSFVGSEGVVVDHDGVFHIIKFDSSKETIGFLVDELEIIS